MARLKLFLDTNIIIDLLADRIPFSNSAYQIFKGAKLNRWKLFTSSNSIITTFYILEQHLSQKKANKSIETILNRIEIQDLNKQDLVLALKSRTNDLEDASQIQCATKTGKINYIVTRDKKGFTNSPIEIINPDELVEILGH